MAFEQDIHPMQQYAAGIQLGFPIDVTLNNHFNSLPAFHDLSNQNNFLSRYFLPFFTAVLLTPRISRQGQVADNHLVGVAYARKISNNIRIFIYNGGSRIIFHNIHLHKLADDQGQEPIHVMTREEYSTLNAYFRVDHGLNSIDGLRIINYEYEVKKVPIVENNVKKFKVRIDLIPNESSRFAYELFHREEYKQLLVNEQKPLSPRLSFFQKFSLFTDYVQFNRPPFLLSTTPDINFLLNYFERVFSYFRPTSVIFRLNMQDQVTLAGLFHGSMIKSLPEVLDAKSSFLFNNVRGEMFWQFKSDYGTGIVDFTPQNHRTAEIGFKVAEALKTTNENVQVEMLRLNYDSEQRRIKFKRRVIQYSIPSLIQNLEDDLRHMAFCPANLLRNKLLTYAQHLQNIVMSGLSNTKILKAHLMGIFKTDQSHSIHLGSKTDSTKNSLIDALLLNQKHRIVLTFENQAAISSLHFTTTQDILIVNLNFRSDETNSLTLGAKVCSEDELDGKYVWRKLANVDANSFLHSSRSMMSLEGHPQLTGKVVKNFHQMVKGIFEDATHIDCLSVYLNGIFSTIANSRIFDKEYRGGFSKLIEFRTNTMTLNLVFHVYEMTNLAKTVASIVNQWQKSKSPNTETIAIAFNPQDKSKKFSVASSLRHFNTEDVNTMCSLRRKRNIPMECPLYEEEIHETKADYEHMEAKIDERYGKQSKIYQHLSKLQQLTGAAQLAFLGRDLVGDLIRGDFGSAAKDVLFFGSTIAYGAIGAKISNFGIQLRQSGMAAAGNSAVAMGLCLPKLGFDIFMGYQLSQQIKSKDKVDASLTSTYLGLDLLTCSYETLAAFGVLEMTPIVGEVATVAGIILLIGQNVYQTIRNMETLEAKVPMKPWEYVYGSLREFFHLGLDENLQKLVDGVEANELVLNYALNNYPNFSRIIVNAATLNHKHNFVTIVEDSYINLQMMHGISKISRTMPRKAILPKNVELFCTMTEEPSHAISFIEVFLAVEQLIHPHNDHSTEKDLKQDYICHNAFGIKNDNSDTNNETLFILGNGSDFVKGFINSSNVFLLENGLKEIQGGNGNDTFIIRGSKMSGHLNGSDGFDTIDFTAADLDHDFKLLIKHGVVTAQKDATVSFTFRDIENIIGRQNSSDHVIVCNQTRIDLGGSLRSADRIFINDRYNCTPPNNLTIVLRDNTYVYSSHKEARVQYIAGGDLKSYIYASEGKHHFELISVAFYDMVIFRRKRELFLKGSGVNLVMKISLNSKIYIKFSDHVISEWTGDYLLAHAEFDMSLQDMIDVYSKSLHENTLVKFYAETHSETYVWDHNHLVVGNNGSERQLKITSNQFENHVVLIGHNAAENYFLITEPSDDSLDIKIHANASNPLPFHIDLHSIARGIHTKLNGSHGLLCTAHQVMQDIIIELFAVRNNEEVAVPDNQYLGKITIDHGMGSIRNIILQIYQQNMITGDNSEFSIKPYPIKIDNATVIILPGNFEFFGQIFFPSLKYHNLEMYTIDKSLIITNVVTLGSNDSMISVVLMDYFSYRNKFNTLKLSFGDKILSWRSNRKIIDEADDISFMWIKVDGRLSNSTINRHQGRYVTLIDSSEWDCQMYNFNHVFHSHNKCDRLMEQDD